MGDIVGNLLSQFDSKSGGIGGLIAKLTNGGLGQHVQSWIGHGENQPVNADQVRQALGEDQITKLAQQAGTTPDEAANQLAQKLPGAVDQLTPEGSVPEAGKVTGLLSKLTGKH
jgi:uncharacterized protein YidB (DUF937 family)